MKQIDFIICRKRTGEYLIQERDASTGKISRTFSNHLTDKEKDFARLYCGRNETPYEITWYAKR